MKAFGSRASGLRLARMQASPLWAGDGFRNQHPVLPGLRDPQAARPTLSEFVCSRGRRVPLGPLPADDPRATWAHAPGSGLRATWLGHSTVLVEIGGLRVLTDPVWGRRASPSQLAGPKRFQPVPVPLSSMPEVDVVVISHDHYDHLDYPTLRALAKTAVPFVTALGVGAHLEAWGIAPGRITELDWWQQWQHPRAGVTITAAPSQHFSGRGLTDRNATLWSSMVVASERHRVFFSGDTGLTTEYADIARRLGPFDLVMLEVGAFHPSWGDIHLGPAHALEALQLLGGGTLLPVHWGTFSLALHDWDEPVETLLALGAPSGSRLLLPRLGQAVEPSHDLPLQPWWRGVDAAAPAGKAPDVADVAADPAAGAGDDGPASGRRMAWPMD